nr:hypothetical protein [Rickettsia bellii]
MVDDEVEDETKLLTETQFLVKKTPHGKDFKYEITGFINKAGEYITEPEQIKQNLKLYAFAEFADLQKNILGKFDKEGSLKISKNFEDDEEIVLRKNGKLLFVKTEKGLVNRQGELKKVNKILQKDGFFFEDSGRDVKVPKSAISPNGKPKKSILKRS